MATSGDLDKIYLGSTKWSE